MKVEKPREWDEMFDDAWRSMKHRFYDPKMHGKDWDAARARYKPLVAFVGDRQELMNVINEMIGELNASHTGASAGGGGRGDGGRPARTQLGLELEDFARDRGLAGTRGRGHDQHQATPPLGVGHHLVEHGARISPGCGRQRNARRLVG